MNDAAWLSAGAILPPTSTTADLDTLVARAYTHPALPTPMVRLAPSNVGQAADLEMTLLGFTPQAEQEVGRVPRQKPGFPAWALVHDPDNARFALDVLERMKIAIRRMRAKPGAAKDLLDEIGETLAASVPHFLPSYYEEAARAFIDHDALTYAQQYFEKARAAERQYNLEVDDDLREAAFVDFALAGALAVKSLSAYADELAARGTDGLETFMRVCVRRTLGGLPPSPAQLKDLARLAKAAGIKPAAAEQDFLSRIAHAPALARAAKGFFTKARSSMGKLVKTDAAAAAGLLDLVPREISYPEWLALLDGWTALRAIVDADAPGQSRLGAAGWLARALAFGDDDRLLALLEEAAPRLKADGTPLGGDDVPLSLRTVELCLSLDVPFELDRFVNFDTYFRGARWPDHDLPHIAAHAPTRALVVGRCGQLSSRSYSSLPDAEVPALAEMLREGLAARLDAIGPRGLAATASALDLLEEIPEAWWPRLPKAREALERIDVLEAFAAQLRFGLLPEVCLPELEALVGTDGEDFGAFVTPPYLTLWSDKRVIVLDTQGATVFEHVPQAGRTAAAVYVGEDLLVVHGSRYSVEGYYWASAPGVRYPLSGSLYRSLFRAHRTSRGDVVAGALIRAGSSTVTLGHLQGRTIVQDGQVLLQAEDWQRYDDAADRFVQADPPAFLDDATHASFRFEVEPRAGAPVRVTSGAYAFRQRDEIVEDAVGPVGRCPERVEGVVWLPHASTPAFADERYREVHLWGSEGLRWVGTTDALQVRKRPWAGAAALPWMVPADEDASRALRQLEASRLSPLLAAASTEEARGVRFSSYRRFEPPPEILEPLAAALPELTDATLRDAIAGVAHYAGKLAHLHATLVATLTGSADAEEEEASPIPARVAGDPALPEALGAFAWRHDESYCSKIKGPTLLSELGELRAWFEQPLAADHRETHPWGHHIWHPGLGHATYLLYRYALCPSKHDDARAHLETTARELVAQGLESGAFRIAFRDQDPQELNQSPYFPTLAALGDNRVLVWQLGYGDDAHYTFVEHAPSGEFQLVDADEDLAGPAWATDERIGEVVAKVAADGPLPLKKALPLLQQKTGLTLAEATLWATAQRTADPLGLVKKGKRAALATFESDPLLPFPTHMFHDLAVGSGVWMAGDWRELWDPEVLATRLADAFLRDHPELQPLTEDDERVLAAGPAGDAPQCKGSVDAAWAARLVLVGLEHPFLDQDRDGWFDHEGYHLDGIKGYSVSSPGFHLGLKWDRHSLTLERLVVPLVAALYEADGHSALVRALPVVWAKLRDRLASEGLYATVRLDKDRVDAIAAELPDTLPSRWRGTRSKTARGDDTRVLVRHGRPTLHVRVDALVAGEPLVADDHRVVTLLRDLALLLGPPSAAFVDAAAAVAGTDRRAGDPRVAAPEVVEALSAHLGVSADAAALYLLLAALPKPTDTTTRLLLGVDKGGLAALGAELLEAGHVLEAKRAGTGRSLFLPGRWVTDRHRSHAIAWKRELLGWGDDTSRHGPSDSAFGGQIPPVAPGPLYRRVWQRIADGDGPRFDEPGSPA